MYKALYRIWRPKTFDDVVGQDHITTTLKNEVKTKRTAHSYLFTGSRGTGKTTCSKILAKAVCCLNPVDGNPCGECVCCKGVDDGSLTDVVEIDAASNNSVDDIRELREEAIFSPAVAAYRVYIVDEAHMLSKGAFNALLKIMEEPPAHVMFILATTEVHKIPQTILSRCQRFDFMRVSPENIAGRLEFIAKNENINLTHDAAITIGIISDGGMRDGVSLLDKCSSVADEVDEAVVESVAGIAGKKHILSLGEKIIDQDTAEALKEIDLLYNMSVDFKRLSENMVEHFRNLMIVKSVKKPENLVLCSASEMKSLKSSCKKTSLSFILYTIDVFQKLFSKISGDSGARALFEMSVIRVTQPEMDISPESLGVRLEQLEKAVASGKTIPRKKSARRDSAPDDNPVESDDEPDSLSPNPVDNPIAVVSVTEEELLEVDSELSKWKDILIFLKSKNPPLHATLEGSKAYVKGDLLLIDAPNTVFLDLMRASDATKESLRNAVESKTGNVYRLGPVKKGTKVKTKSSEDLLSKLAETASEKGIEVDHIK